MKQLKIALICKNENSKKRDDRSMGYFSYDVPEFTWEHFIPGKNFRLHASEFKGFDLVFHEDYPYGDIIGLDIPYVFLSIDSTLTEDHYKARLRQTSLANLVLVDHDNAKRFKTDHCNTYQFPYCVNDKVFYRDDRERTVDIAYHCSSSAHAGIEQRKHIRQLLHDLSVKHKWNYRSGVLPIEQYAESFRTAKIVVNQSRTPTNRPHRILDAMACGAMVLTSKIPHLYLDRLIDETSKTWYSDKCYGEYLDDKDLEDRLEIVLSKSLIDGQYFYQEYAERGYQAVMKYHTWSIRAKQLREIINKEFGI